MKEILSVVDLLCAVIFNHAVCECCAVHVPQLLNLSTVGLKCRIMSEFHCFQDSVLEGSTLYACLGLLSLLFKVFGDFDYCMLHISQATRVQDTQKVYEVEVKLFLFKYLPKESV